MPRTNETRGSNFIAVPAACLFWSIVSGKLATNKSLRLIVTKTAGQENACAFACPARGELMKKNFETYFFFVIVVFFVVVVAFFFVVVLDFLVAVALVVVVTGL